MNIVYVVVYQGSGILTHTNDRKLAFDFIEEHAKRYGLFKDHYRVQSSKVLESNDDLEIFFENPIDT